MHSLNTRKKEQMKNPRQYIKHTRTHTYVYIYIYIYILYIYAYAFSNVTIQRLTQNVSGAQK